MAPSPGGALASTRIAVVVDTNENVSQLVLMLFSYFRILCLARASIGGSLTRSPGAPRCTIGRF